MTTEDFRLPPPPTRSRRIIQMKPGPTPASKASLVTTSTSVDFKKEAAGPKTPTKKQPIATSGAGKKMARKTAHSIIERRRRSKMNEEFGVLKGMIPACRGQEMHKLAILQASIDYMRYLEQCITGLKANNNHAGSMLSKAPLPRGASASGNEDDDDDSEDDREDDVSMGTSPQLQPVHSHDSLHVAYASSATSPALPPTHHRYASYASTVTSQPSPAMYPQGHQQPLRSPYQPYSRPPYNQSTITSPMILPHTMHDADQEATAALLSLHSDRRHTSAEKGGRGISVKDLITS